MDVNWRLLILLLLWFAEGKHGSSLALGFLLPGSVSALFSSHHIIFIDHFNQAA